MESADPNNGGTAQEAHMADVLKYNDIPVPDSVIEFVGETVGYLANQCDGAQDRDGQGFSKAHAGFGKLLAMLPAAAMTADPDLFEANAHLILGYKRQIREWAGDLKEHEDWQWLVEHVGSGNSYRELPEGRILVEDDPTSPLGVSAQVFMRNKQSFPSLNEFAQLGAVVGAYEHDDGHRFRIHTPAQWALMGSMMASGLQNALTEDGEILDTLKERMVRAADRGDLPLHAEPASAARHPVVLVPSQAQLKKGRMGFDLHAPYDPELVSVCRRAKGRWNPDGKCWSFVARDRDALASLVTSLSNPLGDRACFLFADDWDDLVNADEAIFDGYYQPALVDVPVNETAAVLGPLEKMADTAGGVAAALADAAETNGETAEEDANPPRGRLVTGDGGRVIARIALPYEHRHLNQDLKALGARFDWDVKEWVLPINEQNLAPLKEVPLVWETSLDDYFADHEPPPFGYLEIQPNDLIRMDTPYHPDLVEFLRREIPRIDKQFDGASKTWTFRASTPELIAKLKELMQEYRLRLRHQGHEAMSHDEASTTLDALEARLQERFDSSYVADSSHEVDGMILEPFPFQRAGMHYINTYGNSLVGDDCGLGKTPQAIGALLDRQAFPALIACPSIARLSWESEFQKFTDRVAPKDVVVLGIGTEKQKREALEKAPKAKVVIINYDILKKHADLLSSIPFKGAVLDESHYVKTPEAQRTIAAKQVMNNPTLDLKLLLSATPYNNRPSELIPQLEILDKLEAVGGARYLKRLDNAGEHVLAKLNRRLRATCMIRREKREVWDEMPEVMVSQVPCEPDRHYRKVERDLAARIIEAALERADVSALREIASGLADHDPQVAGRIATLGMKAASGEKAAVDFTEISALRQQLGVAKIQPVLDWLRTFRDSTPKHEKLVVFAYHKEVQEALFEGAKKLGLNTVQLKGSQDATERKAQEMKFQEGDARICIASMKAARENITLTSANHCFFSENDYSGGNMIQARDRLIRISQQAATVNVYFGTMRDTLDVNMTQSIQEKMAKITKGLGDHNTQDGLSAEGAQGAFAALVSRHTDILEQGLRDLGIEAQTNAMPRSPAVPADQRVEEDVDLEDEQNAPPALREPRANVQASPATPEASSTEPTPQSARRSWPRQRGFDL